MNKLRQRALRAGLPLALLLATGCPDVRRGAQISSPDRSQTPAYLSEALGPDSFRWTGRTTSGVEQVNLYIEVDDVNVPPSFDQEAWKAIVPKAREIWKAAINELTGVHIDSWTRWRSKERFDSNRTVVHIGFEERSDSSWAGHTAVSSLAKQVNDVNITIAMRRPTTDELFSQEQLLMITLHELGHALGIAGINGATGHSSNDLDVMYWSGYWASLSGGDAKSIRALYSRLPTYTRRNQ